MREQDLAYWPGPVLYKVEIDGELSEADDKVVCRRARLIRKVKTWSHRALVAWACDCVERVLPIFEKQCPEDKRPRNAIEVTRAWLAGKATLEEVKTAADAAYVTNAAYYVARASYAAANAAADATAADATAARAARAARAAINAAYGATCSAERTWQVSRMLEYVRGEVMP